MNSYASKAPSHLSEYFDSWGASDRPVQVGESSDGLELLQRYAPSAEEELRTAVMDFASGRRPRSVIHALLGGEVLSDHEIAIVTKLEIWEVRDVIQILLDSDLLARVMDEFGRIRYAIASESF